MPISLYKKGYSYVFILGILFFGLLSPEVAYAGTLTASVTTASACIAGGGTILLRLSGATNAHAELPGQANTNYDANVICGNGVTGLGNACTGTTATILKLSGLSNAHVEQNTGAYANNACISVTSGSVSVGYQADNCTGFDATIGSMSGTTNAHVGDGNAYTTKICATATGSVPPSLTTYTNDTEIDTAFDYSAACTTCGARIGGGSGFRQSVTITGTDFGADPGAANRSTATNNVKVGAQQIASANVTAWSATSITFLTDTNVAGDADSDWGADFGGTSALTVTAGGATSNGLNFYVFPQITGVRSCDSLGFPVGSKAREYNASDAACPNGLTDGEVFLDGTRFGTSATGGSVTIVGVAAATGSWSNTLIRAQVPASIADSTYTGNLIVQQGDGSNNKTHTYTTTGFRILPRIISNTPASDIVGNVIQIDGNHLCQSGTCPSSPPTAGDKVEFGTTAALSTDFVTTPNCTGASKWSHTQTCVKVPAGTPIGSQPTKVTSNTSYTSNTMAFTVQSSTPNDPTVSEPPSRQWNSAETSAIPVGGATSSSTVVLKADISAGVSINLRLQIEIQPTGTAFTCVASSTPIGSGGCVAYSGGAGALEGTVAGGGGCDACTSLAQAKISFTGLTDSAKHWQARVRNSLTSEYSNWVSYGGNLESETDFNIDTTAPTIIFVPTDDCNGNSSGATTPGPVGSNSVIVDWSLDEAADGQVEYSVNSDLSSSANQPSPPAASSTSHQITISNLNSGTRYYYKVKSRDGAGNLASRLSSQPYCYFDTSSVAQPAKTTKFFVFTSTSTMTSATTTYFTILAPEHSLPTNPIVVKSSYLELTGLINGGTGVRAQVNAVSSKDYLISATNPTNFRILYKIVSDQTSALPDDTLLNFNDNAPCTNGSGGSAPCNKFIITPLGGSIDITSARFIMTYGYTP